MRIDTGGDLMAIYPLQPSCPKCTHTLARPDFWGELEPEQRRNTFQVWCATCKRTVSAKFYTGAYE